MEAQIDQKERQNRIFVTSMDQVSQIDRNRYLDGVMRVEREAWPEEWQASRDKFESRMAVFPEGFFMAFKDREMVGVSTSEIVNYDSKKLPATWDKITDNGYIRKTHNSEGNALYVVSVGVSKRFQGEGIGKNIVESQKELTQKLNLKYLFLGSRIPKFSWYHDQRSNITAEEYVQKTQDSGGKFDPELRFYESCGLKVVEVLPNYGPDAESENYGVIMVWEIDKIRGVNK